MAESESQNESQSDAEEPAVVFLDPGLEPAELEGLSESLARPVRTHDPNRLDDPNLWAGALAIVVPWDLGSQSGLDVVEFLRRGEPGACLPIVVVASEATRGRVRAALHAGATSFARLPYDPEELSVRLDAARDAEGSE